MQDVESSAYMQRTQINKIQHETPYGNEAFIHPRDQKTLEGESGGKHDQQSI
jgi:hypothetical protein